MKEEVMEVAKEETENNAARAAGQAVAAAHVFGHAIHASTYAAKAVEYATNFDTDAVAHERNWQHEHLLDLFKWSK
ncbi:putative immunity protein [Bacillus sp. XF8]|uniref:putative immunity protein n=1 Tax=Bacillus sp. XF8 TaxID=2819289 RepID=UPI001AA043FD|nr:hypothetical protein [Bacillus sp. XF8]MBO1579262.1 hypothetical protein [Bacillus sp. XF8]